MAEEIDSLEQGERARKWMQQNGSSLIIGVLAAVAVLMGYEAWKNSRSNHRARAGETYVELAAAVTENKADRIEALANNLSNEFDDTAYAALAKLDAARLAVNGSKLTQAISAAEAAVKVAHSKVLADTARLRLARLQAADNKPESALATLDQIKSPGFEALVAELRGDVLMLQDKKADALAAYNSALTNLDAGSPVRNSVQMKIDDLSTGS